MALLEGLAGGPSPRIAAHLINSFSTDVEKFWNLKILMRSDFDCRRLNRGAVLCQPILLPTRYGPGTTGAGTSWADAKSRAANPVSRDTLTVAGMTPGKCKRFI